MLYTYNHTHTTHTVALRGDLSEGCQLFLLFLLLLLIRFVFNNKKLEGRGDRISRRVAHALSILTNIRLGQSNDFIQQTQNSLKLFLPSIPFVVVRTRLIGRSEATASTAITEITASQAVNKSIKRIFCSFFNPFPFFLVTLWINVWFLFCLWIEFEQRIAVSSWQTLKLSITRSSTATNPFAKSRDTTEPR